ncbi:MAG TPA: hypothetical protein VEI46_11780 [Thermodesulfovibrionales bacterium]|nr:hypothetical protein [Thermodesulfovibrionales bacterium]
MSLNALHESPDLEGLLTFAVFVKERYPDPAAEDDIDIKTLFVLMKDAMSFAK